MELLETLPVKFGAKERRINLYHGDLTRIAPNEAVDLLVVSAFPNDYLPTPTSLIGALDRAGVSVAEVSLDKAEDLRQEFGCWLSQPIPPERAPGFRRILCFEPALRGSPPEVVGDLFRALMPILQGGLTMRSIAMPLIASGDQRWPREAMFTPLIEAAVRWLELGLSIETIKIVERARDKAESLQRALSELKVTLVHPQLTRTGGFAYDVFLSYAHEDASAASFLGSRLREHESRPRVFQDKLSINPGASWQQKIWDALEACRRVVALYSPDYLNSKVCQEEYAIARLRNRKAEGVLVPLYLVSATLPAYIEILDYVDCRESDMDLLEAALPSILSDQGP